LEDAEISVVAAASTALSAPEVPSRVDLPLSVVMV